MDKGKRLEMMRANSGFEFRRQEIDRGLNDACRVTLLGPKMRSVLAPEQYRAHHIAAVSHRELAAHKRSAFLIPAASLMLTGTLNVLNDADVKWRMRNIREVKDRLTIAADCGARVAYAALYDGRLAEQYADDLERLGLLDPKDRTQQARLAMFTGEEHVRYIAKLAYVTFADVTVVAGGALGALHAHKVRDNAAAIIGASPLLHTAAVPKSEGPTLSARRYLGVPYAHPDNFLVNPDQRLGHRVSYTKETELYLQSLVTITSGCPADGVDLGNDVSLLQEGNQAIVNYLIPEGATVDLPIRRRR